MKRLRQGQLIELGNLWPKRDLIYVTDTAAGLVATAAGPAGLEVFNVGTGSGTAIEDVLRSIGEIRGEPLKVEQVPDRMRDGDGHLIADPGKLMATGWKPEYDLDAGLSRLLEWEGLL
jgi:nucleoside-diphosphate-sugar epimerase